jgi:hypothetical protein
MNIQPGIYQHYKGNLYQVLGMSRHSETLEEMVVYQALYGTYGLWVRPVDMFMGTLEIEGKPVPRFSWVSEGSFKTAALR